ncbi:hypothetical protein BACEGG_02325 [Bacteroides eggerthii DSM 20697]|nr:hypothetical protein BACEGG_02325 [Bacteroides eggerthii DSM 20697]
MSSVPNNMKIIKAKTRGRRFFAIFVAYKKKEGKKKCSSSLQI